MAYQKLQVQSALEVHLSDNANIPNTSSVPASGTTTGTTANKLVDSGETFESKVQVGDIVYNTSDATAATVTAVDSDTQLSLNGDIMASGEAYTIYRGDQSGCVLYVGVGGQVKVTTSGGDTVIFYNLNNGQFVPVNVKKVFATGTTATNLIALW
tara:strand:+ start:344 stop:808 length:465 start_codon:yes stop_codon:yes gene_type:complete